MCLFGNFFKNKSYTIFVCLLCTVHNYKIIVPGAPVLYLAAYTGSELQSTY